MWLLGPASKINQEVLRSGNERSAGELLPVVGTHGERAALPSDGFTEHAADALPDHVMRCGSVARRRRSVVRYIPSAIQCMDAQEDL